MIRRDVTRVEVDRYLAMFEKARRKHNSLPIAIETVISAERFGSAGPAGGPKPLAGDKIPPLLREAMDDIVAAVARGHGIPLAHLLAGNEHRKGAVSEVRHEAAWRLGTLGVAWTAIGKACGVTGPAAMMGARAFQARLREDAVLRQRMGFGAVPARGAKPAARRRAA